MTRADHAVGDHFAALCANEPELATLRGSLREFLVADRAEFGWQPKVDAWLSSWDEQFSARLGGAGFLGLTIPKVYGGHGLSHLHRYVVPMNCWPPGLRSPRTGSPTARWARACSPTALRNSATAYCRKSLPDSISRPSE